MRYFITILPVLLLLVLPSPLRAAECNIYGPEYGVPTGYGASYNVFNTSQMMVSIACNEDESITVTTGNNDPLTYIYKEGYYYNPTTQSWTNFTYSCDGLIADAWCVGQVNKTLTNVPTADANFLVSYTCQWSGSKWNCGCSNSSCSTHSWQLQGWRVQSGGGGPIPTGDATYLNEDFEDAGWASKYHLSVSENVSRTTGTAAHTGAHGLHMHVNKGSHWGGEIRYRFGENGQGGNFDEIWSRHYVKYADNWWREDYRIGKAGFRAASNETCGAPCLEMTDSTHSLDPGGPDAKLLGISYWHNNITDEDAAAGKFLLLTSSRWNMGGRNWAEPEGYRDHNKWYCVELHIKLNPPTLNTGVYEVWLDGVQVAKHTSANFRDGASLDIDYGSLITYIGGSWVADHDMDVYYDDWALSNTRIGCD